MTLKVIGDYTASAISSICFDEPQAVIDGNVYRVLSRYFGKDTPIDVSYALKEFKALATKLMGNESPGEFNQALMEFGALQCTPKNPVCNSCTFQNNCTAFNKNLVSKLPLKNNKIKVTDRYFNYLVFETPNKKTLLNQRTTKGIWQNLYEFPLVESLHVLNTNEISETPLVSRYTKIKDTSVSKINEIPIRHKLSHQQLYITYWKVKTNTLLEEGMFENEVHNYPVPRVLEKFIKNFYL